MHTILVKKEEYPMKYTEWNGGHYDRTTASQLHEAGYPGLLSAVLASRGVTPEQAQTLLLREGLALHDPMLMKDMDKAVERIRLALRRHEKIAVFGDYDVDGITATVLLVHYLRSLGADCAKFIPRRIEDGYGLGKDALQNLRQQGVSLVITVDCGITGVEEAEFAREIGLDLVITDHHECKEILPDAAAVVDPRRSDCPYPFKHLAGVGVALKLVLALGRGNEIELLERYCTLAAIGTVADVMKMSDENRVIVHRGLSTITETKFIGLRALLKETCLWDKAITSIQIGYILAPRINAAGRMGQAELAADLLLTDDCAQAELLSRQLCDLNRERQAVEQEIFSQAVEQLEQLPADQRHALVLASDVWHQGVVGIVASRLSEKYSCPSFMIHLQNGKGKGSCRSYGGFNLFAALEACSDLLADFGGHELAAGFNIYEENIPAFRERMNRYVQEHLGGEVPVSALDVDVIIQHPELLTLDEVNALSRLEPYGSGNTRPVFVLPSVKVESIQSVGQNRHLKLRLRTEGQTFDAIFFCTTMETCGFTPGSRVDAAFYLQINEFRGVSSVQLQLIDLRPSLLPNPMEQASLALLDRLVGGQHISAQDAMRLMPEREQFVALWRMIERIEQENSSCADQFPMLRRLAAPLSGNDAFLRAATCVAVFAERGLISLERSDGTLSVRPIAGRRANLEQSEYMVRLRETIEQQLKGGR